MTDKPSFPIAKGLQRKLYSEVIDWPALWAFVDGFDDIPRVRGGLVERTVTPTLAFRMRYNEDGSINHTLKEIAEHFGVTSNAVRHHIEKGIRRLNHPGRRVDWGYCRTRPMKQFSQSRRYMPNLERFCNYIEEISMSDAKYDDGTPMAEDAMAFIEKLKEMLIAHQFFFGDEHNVPVGILKQPSREGRIEHKEMEGNQ